MSMAERFISGFNLNFGNDFIVAMLILIFGVVVLYFLWKKYGYVKPVHGVIAPFFELPSEDFPPALVGLIVDGQISYGEIGATIMDLNARGYVQLAFDQKPYQYDVGFAPDRVIKIKKLRNVDDSLLDFEKDIMWSLFAEKNEVGVSEMNEKYYAYLPRIFRKIKEETVARGFFIKYGLFRTYFVSFFGLGLFIAQFAIMGTDLVYGYFWIRMVTIILSVGIIILGVKLNPRTRLGVKAREEWLGFILYLSKIKDKYAFQSKTTEGVVEQKKLEKYLPYAMASYTSGGWTSELAYLFIEPKMPEDSEGKTNIFTMIVYYLKRHFAIKKAEKFLISKENEWIKDINNNIKNNKGR